MTGKNDKLSFLSRKALNSTTLTLYFRRNGTTYYTGEMDSIIHRDGVNGSAFCNHLHVTTACMHFISTKCLEFLHYKCSTGWTGLVINIQATKYNKSLPVLFKLILS